MVVSVLRSIPTLLAVALIGGTARAEGGTDHVGDTPWALPGIVRVGVPGAPAPRIGVAATAGFGFIESQSATDSSHQRVFGSAAFSIAPIRALELALRLDGRYDHHSDDGTGAHGGLVGDPRLLARFGGPVGKSFRMGAELGAWFPGNNAPSLVLGATTVDFGLLGAYAPDGGPTVGLRAGFRLDNSHNAATEPNRFRFGDRLVLGLSDFNAVPVGIGLSIPVDRTEVLAEASGDLLIGSGAPSVSESPLRIDAGIRHHVSDAVALIALAEVSPSARPTVGPSEPLVPIEPRASLMLGLTYQSPFEKREAAPAVPAPETPPPTAEKPGPVATSTASVSVTVHKDDGSPAPDASVTVRVGQFTKRAEPAADGKFTIEGIPQGEGELEISAEGAETVKKPMRFSGGAAEAVDVALPKAMPQGEVRGLIRSFNGHGLAASIRVEPIGVEAKADAQGSFKIDVPPGDYEVVIKAEHFKEQRRKVHVDLNGVTILNAEMFEGKK